MQEVDGSIPFGSTIFRRVTKAAIPSPIFDKEGGSFKLGYWRVTDIRHLPLDCSHWVGARIIQLKRVV